MSAVVVGSFPVTVSATPPATSLMAVLAPGTASGQCAIFPLAPTLAEGAGATEALGAGADEAALDAAGALEVLLQLSQPARGASTKGTSRSSERGSMTTIVPASVTSV
jgi:hypothetical protein